MIEERIVISDANVIIDLLSVQLLEAFFALPCEIFTTDFVISEIERPEQQKIIQKFVKSKKLGVASFGFDEFAEILRLQSNSKNNTSIADCSVWYYAKKVNGRLLTGDGKLRSAAEKDNVKVSVILYLFDIDSHKAYVGGSCSLHIILVIGQCKPECRITLLQFCQRVWIHLGMVGVALVNEMLQQPVGFHDKAMVTVGHIHILPRRLAYLCATLEKRE